MTLLDRLRPLRPSAPALAALGVAVVASLVGPMIVTNSAFGADWSVHLWLLLHQQIGIQATGLPTLFIHSDAYGVFYPVYAFYGGTLYAAFAYLAVVVGTTAAYLVGWVVATAIGYVGWLWLARLAGLRGWLAQVPAIVFATSAYEVTNMYARGDWPEFMAGTAIPLLLAALVDVLVADRVRRRAVATLVVASVVFTGSHNITLAWGTLLLAGMLVAALVALPRHGRELRTARLAWAAGAIVAGAAINAWFLVPDLLYAGRTDIGSGSAATWGDGASYFNRATVVFHPLRYAPPESTTPNLDVQLPVLVLLWALVAAIACRRAGPSRWLRAATGLAVVGALGLVLVLWTDVRERTGIGFTPWELVPHKLYALQFAYRLHALILVALCGALLCVLAAFRERLERAPRSAFPVILALLLVLGVAQSQRQLWREQSVTPSRHDAIASRTAAPRALVRQGVSIAFDDTEGPVVRRRLPLLAVGPKRAQARTVRIRVDLPGDETVRTDIDGGPNLVSVSGMRRVGRTPSGLMVLRAPPGGATELTIRRADNLATVGGVIVSLLAIVAALALVAVAGRRRREPQ